MIIDNISKFTRITLDYTHLLLIDNQLETSVNDIFNIINSFIQNNSFETYNVLLGGSKNGATLEMIVSNSFTLEDYDRLIKSYLKDNSDRWITIKIHASKFVEN